jgi:hypothetical protein
MESSLKSFKLDLCKKGESGMKHNKYIYAIVVLLLQSGHMMQAGFLKKNPNAPQKVVAPKPQQGNVAKKANPVQKANPTQKGNVAQKGNAAQKAPQTQKGAVATGASQTQGYLNALGSNPYAKIKQVLTAPEVDKWGSWDKNSKMVSIDPQAFDAIIKKAIETERNNPSYYAFYHGSQKEGFLTHLIRTYISQIEHGWTRDDFFLLRSRDSFYKKSAKTALDYMNQNMPSILQQFIPAAGSKYQNCDMGAKDLANIGYKCTQFDLGGDWRNQLISTSPAMVAGVDDTPQAMREMSEEDWAAWESSFYYFAQGLTWSNVLKLYGRLITELKQYSPNLFKNNAIDNAVRKYIAFKFGVVAELLFPHPRQKMSLKPGDLFEIHSKAGMMFQFLIPGNIVDDVVYLAWANGILWQRKINGIDAGWDNVLGAYVKVSPILDVLKTNPQKLGRSINLLQTRIIYKDEQYFNDPKSPVKINVIHSLPQPLFTSLQDILKEIARVIVEDKQATQKGTQKTWFEQTDLNNTVQIYESKLNDLLASNKEEDHVRAMNTIYYLIATDVDRDKYKKMADRFKNSNNAELKKLSEEIAKL